MIFAVINQGDGDEGYVFRTRDEFCRNVFNPNIEVKFATDFSVRGKDYAGRKEYARELAISLQYAISDAVLSYGEYGVIGREMERIAQRYGLREEFHENCII